MVISHWTKANPPARAITLCWGTHFSFFNGSIVNEAGNPKVNKDPVKKTSRFILGNQGSQASCLPQHGVYCFSPFLSEVAWMGYSYFASPHPDPPFPLLPLVKSSATWGWARVEWGLKLVKIWGLLKIKRVYN